MRYQDYLTAQRLQREASDAKRTGLLAKILEKDLIKDRLKFVQQSTKLADEKARQKERRLRFDNRSAASEEVSQMYLNSIKAKLQVLAAMGESEEQPAPVAEVQRHKLEEGVDFEIQSDIKMQRRSISSRALTQLGRIIGRSQQLPLVEVRAGEACGSGFVPFIQERDGLGKLVTSRSPIPRHHSKKFAARGKKPVGKVQTPKAR